MCGLLSKNEVLERIRLMDPYEFEILIGKLWERRGFDVNVRKGSGDRGIDIEAYSGNVPREKHFIQVKRYGSDNKIGSKQVRQYATIYQQEHNITSVVLLSTGYFTDEARTLANDLDVVTINGDELFRLLDLECPDLVVECLRDIPDEVDATQSSSEEFSVNDSPFDSSQNWKHVNPNQTHFEICPECDSGPVWFGKLNGVRHLKCESCSSEWVKEKKEVEKKGLFFSSTTTEIGWREIAGPNKNKFQSKHDWR